MATTADAWTVASQKAIGEQAARLAPPDLYRQLVRNRASFLIGIEEPNRSAAIQDRYKYPDGSGRLDEAIRISVENAIAAIRAPRPFNEICYRLGIVAHFVALANNPIHTDGKDPQEQRYSRDYLRYLESIAPRVRMVFYGFRQPASKVDLRQILATTLHRSRELYPMVGREYRRVGYGSGVRLFDDRSTAYAVAALGYSHAVSDIAEVLRYIWLQAGGADSRQRLPQRGRQFVPLSPLAATGQSGRFGR